MRILKFAGAAFAAVIVILVLLLIVGLPSGFLTSAIQARVERETGYRLTVNGATRIGLWPQLKVTLNDLTLQDPKDRDAGNGLTVGSVQAEMTLDSVWSGHPQITRLSIVRPVLRVPLLRERTRALNPPSRPSTSSGEADANIPGIDRATVTDGIIVFSNARDRVENRVEGINAEVAVDTDRKIEITGRASAGAHPLQFAIKAKAPVAPLARQNIPLELTLDAADLLQAPLTARAEVRINGQVLMINGLTGTLGDGAFNGWASADLSSKPLVKLDLDFQRLEIATSKPGGTSTAPSLQPRSNTSIDLIGLNYADLQAKISAAELHFGDAHLAPAAVEAVVAGGVLKARFANLGVYGGQASFDLSIDASTGNPGYALHGDLSGVRALPLLAAAADFDKLDGKMQAKIAVHSSGASPHAIMSNLGGTAFAVFQDGAIRGLNVAQMIRALTSGTLSGWQEEPERSTDLTQLSASFRIENGQATTGDLNLVGPLVRVSGAGTVDLAAQSLSLRVEPKLVMTTQGQGRTSDPVGLGIPVVIDGPWAEPRIYPDVSGILENPDATYARLKAMGQGLFGANGGGLGALGGRVGGGSGGGGQSDQLGGKLGETLGNLIQQGLGQGMGQGRNIPAPASPAPAASAQNDSTPPPSPDSQPMNDVLRQLFNR
jgi:AsmA protein